ncbi:branched-chain amino acid ABC transporter permease [Nocardioides sp.]|uniref:branched-chain amino acid ABC transporter permease n=1 Tax=Nocardioides sp. TaxID=35761 RepID=UPI0037839ED7
MDLGALFGSFDSFLSFTIGGLVFGAIYALIALGYTMVYGVLQLINFAHSEVFMYGTFAVAWTFVLLHGTSSATWTLSEALPVLLVALVVAMAVSALIALLLERVAYRPLIKRGAPKLIILISAIGASFALSEAMGLRDRFAGWVGADSTLANYVSPDKARDVYTNPVTIEPSVLFNIGGYGVTNVDVTIIVSALLLMVLLDQLVRRTKFGRGIRSVAQDPESAALMGVNATRVVQLTFLIGGIAAGVAATLYMMKIGATRQSAGFILGVKAFTAAVMGGIGNLRGALLGGLTLGVMENWGAAIFGNEWRDVVAFVLLVLVLLVRPSGILGESLGKARA